MATDKIPAKASSRTTRRPQQRVAIDLNEVRGEQNDSAALMVALGRTNMVIEFQPDGTVITANENFLNGVGYSLDEVRGKHHRMFCDSQYVQSTEYREFWAKLQRGEFVTDDFKRIAKGGREVWIRAAYNPIVDANGKVLKVVKFATDITDRKSVV